MPRETSESSLVMSQVVAAFLFVRVHLLVALLSFYMQVSLQQFPVTASYAIFDLL